MVRANVKSSWRSGINWVAIPMAVSSILALFGIIVPPETQNAAVQVYEGVMAAGAIFVFVKRTFFTSSLTQASVNRMEMR